MSDGKPEHVARFGGIAEIFGTADGPGWSVKVIDVLSSPNVDVHSESYHLRVPVQGRVSSPDGKVFVQFDGDSMTAHVLAGAAPGMYELDQGAPLRFNGPRPRS